MYFPMAAKIKKATKATKLWAKNKGGQGKQP